MATVRITGSYIDAAGNPATGHVLFAPLLTSGAWGPPIRSDLIAGALAVTLNVGNYLVTERVGVASRAPYTVYASAATATAGYSVTPVPSSSFTPVETLALTAGTFTYAIPASASMIFFEVLAGGGGGGSGSTRNGQHQVGGGGGGGGGRSIKFVNATALRAAYPAGISYTVGAGGAGAITNVTPTSDGTTGAAGGYSFVGDFVVATPGNSNFLAQGGGIPAGGLQGFGGAQGLGDTNGSYGGYAGGIAQFYTTNNTTTADGAPGGYPIPQFGFTNGIQNATVLVLTGGGAGAGGGGGGVNGGVAGAGGASGLTVAANPTPLTGTGGIVGGAGPGVAGNSIVGPGIAGLGGGGGGAASLTTNGQAGATAAANSGAGGGGGGSTDHSGSSGGAGGTGGSGFVRIIAY